MSLVYANKITSHQVITNFQMHELYTLIRTVYGEARGESLPGQGAVVHVILNRVQKQREAWGLTVKEVCMKPKQFSFWDNPNVVEDITMEGNLAFVKNLIWAIHQWEIGWDFSYGATHYHTRTVSPKWAEGHKPCTIIGKHIFYNDIK